MDYLLAPFSATQIKALLQRHGGGQCPGEVVFGSGAPSAGDGPAPRDRAPILDTGETGTGKR